MTFRIYASAGIILTLVGLGSASSANAASHNLAAGPPKFYVEAGFAPHGAFALQDVVRATATGAITGTIRCPGPRSAERDVAAAGGQTFFVTCNQFGSAAKNPPIIATRIFRFKVSAAGRIGGLSLVPGGTFKGDVSGLTASANAAEVAVFDFTGQGETVVINTKTGKRAVWVGGVMPGGEIFFGGTPSLTADGKELAVFSTARCPKGAAPGTCKSPGEEMRVVSPASAGGKLASGRMVFRQSQLTKPSVGYINDAFINSGGTTLTAGIVASPGLTSSYVEAISVSVATAKTLKVDFKLKTGNGFSYNTVSADPSGQWVLFDAGPSKGSVNGWVNKGKLVPLKPAGGNVREEVWGS